LFAITTTALSVVPMPWQIPAHVAAESLGTVCMAFAPTVVVQPEARRRRRMKRDESERGSGARFFMAAT
jgi:hypothetical protein